MGTNDDLLAGSGAINFIGVRDGKSFVACLDAGLTVDEAKCFDDTGKLAWCLAKLPTLHPSDLPELYQAIHVIQNFLLGRPAQRVLNGGPPIPIEQLQAEVRRLTDELAEARRPPGLGTIVP